MIETMELEVGKQGGRELAFDATLNAVAHASAVTVRVYHGTSQAFDAFAPNERGLFFAEERAKAENFVRVRKGTSPRVIEAELDIRRPWTYIYYGLDTPMRDMLDQSTAALVAQGYDGAFMPRERVWVAFEPEQVRIVDAGISDMTGERP